MRLRSAWLLPALAVVHAALWAIALSSSALPWTPRQALAQYLSTFVVVVASLNLLLATRARPLERAFGGLDKMFASHRLDGVVVGFVLLGHVTIVQITTPLAPGRLVGLTAFTLIVGSVVLAIAPRAPWRKLLEIPYQTWKAEHRFMGVFVAIAVWHSLLVPTLVRDLPLVRAYVYGAATLGLLAYVYRGTVFRLIARRHRYLVSDVNRLGDRVLEARLEPVSSPIAYSAGQFAFARFDGGPSHEAHPFTISAAPADGSVRFSIKGSGDFTDALQTHLAAGSEARVEGPYGMFDFRSGKRRQLWLAGGIGITPFLAFLPTVETDREIMLVWSVRHEDQAIYRAELESLAAEKPGVNLIVWPTSSKGHLDVTSLGLADLRELSIFICGPVEMRESYLEQLTALGSRRTDIHYEEFTLR